MIFERHGISASILDSDDNELPEYQVQEVGDDTIQCWIPSTEGQNFKVLWKVVENVHPKYDLRTIPILDGVRMSGMVSKHRKASGLSGRHFRQRTGASTARLYEFGRRILSDGDDCASVDPSVLNSLNTVKLIVDWGRKISSTPRTTFYVPQEIGPIHEKAVKKGHSGAAKLGTAISISSSNIISFQPSEKFKPITFMFCYAPKDWLQARDIVPRSPKPESQGTRGTLKRQRSVTPDIIDIDDLESDDEGVQVVKHMIPASTANNKRQRTERQDDTTRPKKEEN